MCKDILKHFEEDSACGYPGRATGTGEKRERGARLDAALGNQEVSRQRAQATGTSERRERGAQDGAHRHPWRSFTAAGPGHWDTEWSP